MITNNTAAQNLAFVLSGAGVDPADLIRRSDYQSEGEYYIALAKAAEAIDNPRVRAALVKVRQQERERAAAEERKAERERIREAAENWKLTPEQLDEIQSRATADAAKEYSTGKLKPGKTIAARQRELSAEYEKKERTRLATNEAFNRSIRDAWRAPTQEDLDFADRIVNRPVIDPDA